MQGLGTRLQYSGFEYILISDILWLDGVLKTGLATLHNIEGMHVMSLVGHSAHAAREMSGQKMHCLITLGSLSMSFYRSAMLPS